MNMMIMMMIKKFSFVNRTIKNWNQLPAEALGTSPVNLKFLEREFGKAFISGMKRKEKKCGENRLKVQ